MATLVEINVFIRKRERLPNENKPEAIFNELGNKFEVYGKLYINPASVVSVIVIKNDFDGKDYYALKVGNKLHYTDEAGYTALTK